MKNIDQSKAAVKVYALDTLEDFKWWRLQNKLAADLLKEIIFRWRGSNAKVPGDTAPWVAYPHRMWRIWMGNISESKLERGLKKLVDNGLLERERHQFAGTTVCAFFRPTVLALKHMGRAEDIARLGHPSAVQKPLKLKHFDGSVDGTLDGTGDGTLDGTDPTTFPSVSSYSSNSTKKEPDLTTGEGKGKDGKEKKKGKLKIVHTPAKVDPEPTPEPVAVNPPIDPDDLEFSAEWEKLQIAKAKNQNKLYPELKGSHEKAVKHPAKQFPEWAAYSHEIKAKLYAKYETYVANWYKGKKGKPYADDGLSDDEWAKTSAVLASWGAVD